MGYTHYWRRPAIIPRACWFQLRADVERLVKASPVPLAFEYDDPTHRPELSSVVIRFNGVREAGFEAFLLPRLYGLRDGEMPDAAGRRFQFCKTNYKAYDLLVTSTLISVKHRLGDLVIVESDGEDEEWQAAREFCLKVLGYGARYHIQGRALVDVSRMPDATHTNGESTQQSSKEKDRKES